MTKIYDFTDIRSVNGSDIVWFYPDSNMKIDEFGYSDPDLNSNSFSIDPDADTVLKIKPDTNSDLDNYPY